MKPGLHDRVGRLGVRRAPPERAMGIEAPVAKGVSGIVHGDFTPNNRKPEQTVGDLPGYTPPNPDGADSTLTVRDGAFGRSPKRSRARSGSCKGNTVTMAGGFEPGRTYQLSYRVVDPPVAGAGLLAFRDVGHLGAASRPTGPASRRAMPTRSANPRADGSCASSSTRAATRTRRGGRCSTPCGRISPAPAGISLNERCSPADEPHDVHERELSVRERERSAIRSAGARKDCSTTTARAGQRAEDVLHEYRRGILGRRSIGGADSHDARRQGRPHAARQRARVFPDRLAAQPRAVSADDDDRPAAGESGELLVDDARRCMVAMDKWVRQGRRAAAEPGAAPRGRHARVDRTRDVPGDSRRPVARRSSSRAARTARRFRCSCRRWARTATSSPASVCPRSTAPVATYTGWNFRNREHRRPTELVSLMGSSIPSAEDEGRTRARERSAALGRRAVRVARRVYRRWRKKSPMASSRAGTSSPRTRPSS